MLVALTEVTGFFDAEEVAAVREMASSALAHSDSDEYTWLVYRDAPGAPPLGYACYGPVSFTDGTYDLYWVAVAPEQQNKKIGKQLLDAMEEDLTRRGARQVYIETSDRPQYTPTRRFYERRGYRQIAHFPDYYAVGDGKITYFKTLDER